MEESGKTKKECKERSGKRPNTLSRAMTFAIAFLVMTSIGTNAHGAVNFSEKFVGMAKEALRDVALKKFVGRVCGKNDSCRVFAELVVSVVEGEFADSPQLLRDRLVRQLAVIAVRNLMSQALKGMDQYASCLFKDEIADDKGRKVIEKFRSDVADCVADAMILGKRNEHCGASALDDLVGNARPEFALSVEKAKKKASSLKRRVSQGYVAPAQVASETVGILTELFRPVPGMPLSKCKPRPIEGGGVLASPLTLTVLVNALHHAFQAPPTSTYHVVEKFLKGVEVTSKLAGFPSQCNHVLFKAVGALRKAEVAEEWVSHAGDCCPKNSGPVAAQYSNTAGDRTVIDEALESLRVAIQELEEMNNLEGAKKVFLHQARKVLEIEKGVSPLPKLLRDGEIRNALLASAAAVDFLLSGDERVFDATLAAIFPGTSRDGRRIHAVGVIGAKAAKLVADQTSYWPTVDKNQRSVVARLARLGVELGLDQIASGTAWTSGDHRIWLNRVAASIRAADLDRAGLRLHISLGFGVTWSNRFGEVGEQEAARLGMDSTSDLLSESRQEDATLVDIWGVVYQFGTGARGLYVGLGVGGFLDPLTRRVLQASASAEMSDKTEIENYETWRGVFTAGWRQPLKGLPLDLEVQVGTSLPFRWEEAEWGRLGWIASLIVVLPLDEAIRWTAGGKK